MYKGILHLHTTTVVIFMLIYLIKNILFLSNKAETLQAFIRKTKVLEMVMSLLFLLTGIYLWVNTGNGGTWLYVKVVAVVASIPLAIIGFKKNNKFLALLSFILLIYSFALALTKSVNLKKETPTSMQMNTISDKSQLGQMVYIQQCQSCHGEDGKSGLSGANDLSTSALSLEDRIRKIEDGKGAMPGFKGVLSKEQIETVAGYLETLRK